MNILEARNCLVKKRIESGLLQSDMAGRMKCSQAFVSKLETGESVGWRALESYAEALNVELEILIK